MRTLRSFLVLSLTLAPSVAYALGGPAPGAVNAQTVRLPAGPGSIRGLADNASVDGFTGQVRYSVPIPLPAGPGGLTPSLSLGYDGELGNGPLGIGWSLSQAGVRRSLRLGIPAYDATDEIELVGLGAGGQIVALANGELRVEGHGNAFTGRTVDGGYELTDADGKVYRFGTTASTRKASGPLVSAWLLEEVRDPGGNTVAYQYVTHEGELHLAAIEWGPTVDGARAFRAALEYDDRSDAVVSFRTGFRVESGKRLARVKVWSFGAVQRVVEIGYDDQFALTRVASVRVTSADGSEELPLTRFTYATTDGGAQTQVTGLAGWALNVQGTSLFDVDNDGAMDLLRLTTNGHSWRRNLGGQFTTAAPMTGAAGSSLSLARLVDLDGDSVAEMLLQSGSQWIAHKLDRPSASWVPLGPLVGSGNLSLTNVTIADLNGDQRMDVLASAGSQIQVRLGTAAGLAAPFNQPRIDSDPTRTMIRPGDAFTSFYDLNGDGLADAIYQASSAFYLYLGRGDGTFERYVDTPYPWSGSYPASQVRLGDLDRDGLLDVALVTGGEVALYAGRANGGLATTPVAVPRPAGTDSTVVVAVADTNGNGSEDLVWSSDAGMWILDLAGPTTAGMLRAVDNGLGQTQQFGYDASTKLMFAAEAAGAPWTRRMPISVPVAVSERLLLASGEPTRSARLDVRDGIYDAIERRFIGFERSTVARPDPADGVAPAQTLRMVTRYAPGLGADRVLRGQVIEQRIEDGLGTVFLATTNEVAALEIAGLPAADPRLRRAVVRWTETRHHEGQPTPIATRSEYSYDTEGRVVETRELGRLDISGDESIARTQYTAGRSARGVRDRACETSLSAPSAAGGEVLLARTQTLFGDEASIAPACDAATGWAREVRAYLISEARWIATRETSYTAHGIVTQTRDGGVTRELELDAHAFQPVAEIVRPSAQSSLRWVMQWNEVQQVPTRLFGADGVAMVVSYDGLGRPLAFAREGAAPHQRFVYHAAGPRPYAETFLYDGRVETVPAAAEPWTPTSRWRHSIEVFTSAGETLFTATRLDVARWIVTARRVRDALGRTVAISDAYEWSGTLAELVASELPASAPVRTVAYDVRDRPVVQTLADGTTRTTAYAAFRTTSTAQGLAPVISTLDGRGQVMRTERTVGGVVEAVEATYDAAGRITAMRLPAAGGDVIHAFTYDSLGRLVAASDPDIGDRALAYSDAGHLVSATNGAGQTTSYAYDGAGRLASVIGDDGSAFVYHYDAARAGKFSPFRRTAGRLAWVEEPTGIVDHGYDWFGRPTQIRRTVNGRTADEVVTLGASGIPLAIDDADGFALAFDHDAAGRPTNVGELWTLEEQDAAGRVLRERFGNGVVQRYERDVLGQTTRIRIDRPDGGAIHDVAVTRSSFGAILSATDHDAIGLDHSGAFGYDGGARLVSAVIGQGPAAHEFAYRYDGLQNMIGRDVTGPAALGILAGTYRYGEPDAGGVPRGPRQLTSVVPPSGPATTLDYDGAGRVVRQGDRTLAYNGFDRLTVVAGVAGGSVSYAYGYDGTRVSTIAPDGSETIRFSPTVTEKADGTREIDVRVGDRLVARVTRAPAEGGPIEVVPLGGIAGAGSGPLAAAIVFGLLGLAAWLYARVGGSRRGRAAVAATLAASALVLTGCHAGGATSTAVQATRVTSAVTYYHPTFAAGPAVITRADGTVLDERRHEPFGAPIDADYALDPHNVLDKETDPLTGWSDHGARWFAPETARWLTPDPPVKAPDPKFMTAPWALHPYQYVEQNPILYWDPDGRDKSRVSAKNSASVTIADTEIRTLSEGDHHKVQVGALKASFKNGDFATEFTGLKVRTFATTNIDGYEAGVEGTVSVASARAKAGSEGFMCELVLVESKVEARISETKFGASFGLGWGGGFSFAEGHIKTEFKFFVGFKFETSVADLRRIGDALKDPVSYDAMMAEGARQSGRREALVSGIADAERKLDLLIEMDRSRGAVYGPEPPPPVYGPEPPPNVSRPDDGPD
jgi:RHS repeat-associated protein